MGTPVRLVRPYVQHCRVHDPIRIAVHVLQLVHFRRVTFDQNMVPFRTTEIFDQFLTETFNPVVVNVIVLARHSVHSPVDRTVRVHVLEDNMFLGVDQRLEVEQISTATAHQHIVAFDRLTRIVSVAG